jgi:hypothetical protein
MELPNSKLSELSPMLRRSNEAIQRGKKLMERTGELLLESRKLLMSKPILPWPRPAKAQRES